MRTCTWCIQFLNRFIIKVDTLIFPDGPKFRLLLLQSIATYSFYMFTAVLLFKF